MIIDETIVEKTIHTLEEAGLHAYYTPTNVFPDFVACGDMYRSGEMELVGWTCYIRSEKDEWFVCPPPHWAGRHNPEYRLPLLEEAVALTTLLFQRRLIDFDDDKTRQDEFTYRLVEEWKTVQQ